MVDLSTLSALSSLVSDALRNPRRRAQDGSPMTRMWERPMLDRHGAHRKRRSGSEQLDLFAPGGEQQSGGHAGVARASGPYTPEATELMVRLMLDPARDPRDPGVAGHDV